MKAEGRVANEPDAKKTNRKKGKGMRKPRVRTEVLKCRLQQMTLCVDCIQQRQVGQGVDWLRVIKPEIHGILYQEEP